MDFVLAVFFAALIFVPIGLIIWACVRAVRYRHVWTEGSSELPWERSDAEGRVLAAVTPVLDRSGYRLENQSQGAIVFAKSYRPIWLLIPCILFFPLGLLSLIYSKTVFLNFTLEPQASRTSHVAFSGHAPQATSRDLDFAIDESVHSMPPPCVSEME